jgi:hypothetical protein
MPTVATYGPRKVGTAAIPGARLTAAETPESEGIGLARANEQLGQTLGQIGGQVFGMGARSYAEAVQQERDRADSVALLNANNQLAKWENQRIYDPQSGALTVKGNNSFGLPETINAEYDKVASDIEATLSTDKQRQQFARARLDRGAQLDLTLRRHVYGEMQRYEGQELNSLIENSQQAAIANATDIRRVGVELNRQVDAITTHAPRLGMGPEEVTKQINATRSATHVGVLQNLLAKDQQQTAQIYYDETKSQINGDQIARIEKSLNEGKVRGESQKQVDAIVAAGGTFTDQLAKARAIEDPEVRDATETRLEQRKAVNDRLEREANETASKTAYNIIDQTGDVYRIPPSAWQSFTGGERSAMISYAGSRAKGVAVETDIPTYYTLMQKASADPEAFSQDNLLRYRAKLGDTEFKQLAGLQNSIRNGDREKAEKDLGPARLQEGVIDDSLTLYGIDPKAKPDTTEGKAIAQLRGMLRSRVEAQQALTGKPVNDVDVRAMSDAILSQSSTVKGSWWNIFPGGKPFFDTQKRLIDLTIGDVPAEDRSQIERALKLRNRPISDATVLDLYLETRARTGK